MNDNSLPRPTGKEKTVAGQVDFVRSFYISQRRFKIKTAVFFLKNENTEGVLKSPIFKNTAVSGRVLSCSFCYVIAPMIFTS